MPVDASNTLTFLFSDIEGSTRLWEQQPDAMRAALAGHDALARASVEAHAGRVVKTTGDGLHAAFDDPADAVHAVLRMQRALIDPAATGGLTLRVRCGLHSGAHESRDGDFYGPTVNRAARISSVAHGGQTLLSQALVDQIGGRLPPNATLRALGAVRLRDLTAPECVYQLEHPQLPDRFPPLRSLESTPNNLTQQLNSFVGREHELAEVGRLLAANRLLTLLGMGGIGKSRLSVQLGADLLDAYPDGVWLIELAPLTDPRGVPHALASVIGVKEEAGQPVVASLLDYVRDRRLLFILDNCEHLLAACAALAKQLLQAGAGVKVLATSRAALQVAGERCFAVSTLSVPDSQPPHAIGDLTRHEAVRLFVDRAAAAQPAFRLTPGNAGPVADICRRLDGIPLAIELAAARTRTLSVEAIAARLSDRFRLLVSGDLTVLPRQRTLRALIDWSHDLLSEPERVLFRRLAVFAGGWTLDAAEAVGSDGLELAAAEVADLLSQLVEKSLVVMEPGGARYRLLDTVRQYAQQRLAATAEQPAVQTRHLSIYLDCAETARPALTGPQQGAWMARLDFERDNFHAAHRWSEHIDGGDTLGVRLLHALRPYWINRGELTVGLGVAVDLLRRAGLQQRDSWRCMALFAAGWICFLMGRTDEADGYLSECLSIARESRNTAIAARVLQPLGMTSLARRDFSAAQRYLDEAVAMAARVDDPRELATAYTALAMLHRMQNRLDVAEPICRRVIELASDFGDTEIIGGGLLNLAMVLIGLDKPAQAVALLRRVAAIIDETGSQPINQSAIEVCAGLAAAAGRWRDAATFLGAAQARHREVGLRRAPADEAFLAPLVEQTAAALGPLAFAEHQSTGRRRPCHNSADWIRRWLDGEPA